MKGHSLDYNYLLQSKRTKEVIEAINNGYKLNKFTKDEFIVLPDLGDIPISYLESNMYSHKRVMDSRNGRIYSIIFLHYIITTKDITKVEKLLYNQFEKELNINIA